MKLFIKYFPYCFLLVFLSLWMAYPLYYSISIAIEKHAQQEKISSRILKAEYETIDLASHDFAEHYDRIDKELYIDGVMYDVISVTGTGDTVSCLVLNDQHETKLLSSLFSFLKNKKEGKGHSTHMLSLLPAFTENYEIYTDRLIFPEVEKHHPSYKDCIGTNYTYKQEKPPCILT